MKCLRCGAELSEDAKFCSYCGSKIEEALKQSGEGRTVTSPTFSDKSAKAPQKKTETSKSLADKIKEKASAQWSKLSIYGKIATVAIAVFVLLCLAALLFGKTAAVVIAVIQIALTIVSILMHKGIIKLEQKQVWLKWIILVIAVLMTVLNVMSYSWGKNSQGSKDKLNAYPVSDISGKTDVFVSTAAPYGAAECVGQDYLTTKSAFSSAGFTIVKAEKIEDLKAADADKMNTVESISVGGKTDFSKGQEFNSDDEVIIRYHSYEKCNVTIHVDFVPNLIFSKYDVNLLLNNINKGTLEHGEDRDFEFSVDPGEYTLTFESDESSSVKGEVTLTIDCDIEASYKISCYNNKVSVETLYVDRLTALADGEVKLDVAASEYKHENFEEVKTALETLGFTNIKYEILYDIVWGWTDDGEVESVSIAGNAEFNRGDIFPADAEIIITYHMPEDDNPSNTTVEEPAVAESITIDNNSDFAAILTSEYLDPEKQAAFISTYKGKIVEFDCIVYFLEQNAKYKTIYSYILVPGEDQDNLGAAMFYLKDMSMSAFKWDRATRPEYLTFGSKIRIQAEVVSGDDPLYIYLNPVCTWGR